VFDADGWLHSGDVGKVDADGFYTITGRIKVVIVGYLTLNNQAIF
jgi:long-subunit acyl-CoA synthetase (AMP-forming)